MHVSAESTALDHTREMASCDSVRVSARTSTADRLRFSGDAHSHNNAAFAAFNSGSSSLSLELQLSETVACATGRSTPLRLRPSTPTEGGHASPNASRHTPELVMLTPQMQPRGAYQPRYSSCNQSTELGMAEPATSTDDSPQTRRLLTLPLNSSHINSARVSGAAADRYPRAATDSAAFSPRSVSSVARSGHNDVCQIASLSVDGAAPFSLGAPTEEMPVFFYETHSPRKRVRGDGEPRDDLHESPSSRYRAMLSSQMSYGEGRNSSLGEDVGRGTQTDQSLSVNALRTDASVTSTNQAFGSPCVNLSSETSLRLLPKHVHRTRPAAVHASDTEHNTADCLDGSPLVVSSSAALVPRAGSPFARQARLSDALAASSSMVTADSTAGPVCADSTQFFNAIPTVTTSIPRPTPHRLHDSSPQVEGSLEESSVDLTRMPIPGDVRINILGNGAPGWDDDDDDDDSDVDDAAREKRLDAQVQRIYGRIVKAHQKAAGETEATAETGETGETAETTARRPPHLAVTALSSSAAATTTTTPPHPSSETPYEVVARSPQGPRTPSSPSPRAVRFHVPDSDSATPAPSLPPPPTITVGPRGPPKRHVGFQLATPPASAPVSPSMPHTTTDVPRTPTVLVRSRPSPRTSPVTTPDRRAHDAAPGPTTGSVATPPTVTTGHLSGPSSPPPAAPETAEVVPPETSGASASRGPTSNTSNTSNAAHAVVSSASVPPETDGNAVGPRVRALHSDRHYPLREPKPPAASRPSHRASASSASLPSTSVRTGGPAPRETYLPRLATPSSAHAAPTVTFTHRRSPYDNNANTTASAAAGGLPTVNGSDRGEKNSASRRTGKATVKR